MKITIPSQTSVEIEINLPYYFRIDAYAWFAITSETEAYYLTSHGFDKYDFASAITQHIGKQGWSEITAEEFNNQYQIVLANFSNKKFV